MPADLPDLTPRNGHPVVPAVPEEPAPPPPLEDLVIDLAAQALRSLPPGVVAPPGGCEAAARRGGVEVVVRVRPAAGLGPEEDPGGYLITLDQMAAVVRMKKDSLRHYKRKGLPPSHRHPSRGRAELWAWGDVRPWLEQNFGVRLPVRFPGS